MCWEIVRNLKEIVHFTNISNLDVFQKCLGNGYIFVNSVEISRKTSYFLGLNHLGRYTCCNFEFVGDFTM